MYGLSDLLNVLKPLLEEVLLGCLTSIFCCLSCSRTNLRNCACSFLGLSLYLAVTINPVSEGKGYVFNLTADIAESFTKLGPNTTILNSVPSFNQDFLELDKLIFEPLDLLRDLELLTEFVELGSQRSDNCLSRRHVS